LLRVFTGPSGKSTSVDAGPFATKVAGGGEFLFRKGFFVVLILHFIASEFRIPYAYAGQKTFPGTTAGVDDYAGYSKSFVYDINIPGCALPGKVFVGQRQEPFGISLGEVFDLVKIRKRRFFFCCCFLKNCLKVNMDPTTGGDNPAKNSLARKAVTALALEIPTSCLNASNTVIGGWASVQHLTHVGPSQAHVAGAQKNRLGNPLINELFIGLTDKDQVRLFSSFSLKKKYLFVLFFSGMPKCLATIPSTQRICSIPQSPRFWTFCLTLTALRPSRPPFSPASTCPPSCKPIAFSLFCLFIILFNFKGIRVWQYCCC
jgi:hypothetical protein